MPIFAATLGQGIMWSNSPVSANIVLAAQMPNGTETPPPSGGSILLEDSSGFIELEDGSGVILLEV